MLRLRELAIGALSVTLAAALGTTASAEPTDLAQIEQYTSESYGQTVGQVNSVSELTDVDPNSWAFQALKSVVERFGCLEGYPNKTYRGNRPLTRYEFAAGLNACLERVNELITAGTANAATKEDLATLQRLQEEFRNELAALRGRVDALEAKTKEIESKLFSTTSKLDGSVVMAVTGGGTRSGGTIFTPAGATGVFGDSPVTQNLLGGLVAIPGTQANASFVARTTLNLRATITGSDELLIRLRGVTGQDLGAVFPNQAANFGTLFYALGPGNNSYDASTIGGRVDGAAPVSFDKIRYLTNLSENFRVFVGPRIDIYEFIDTNSVSNEETDFSSGFTINNSIITFYFTGPGFGFDWDITPNLAWRALYFAPVTGGSATTARTPNGNLAGGLGLFGENFVAATELEFNPSKTSFIKLQYARINELGTLFATNISSLARTASTDTVGVSVEWAVAPQFLVFGRYGYLWSNLNDLAPGASFNTATGSLWQGGFALPNLFGAGNQLGIIYGQPIRFDGGQFNGNSFRTAGVEQVLEVYYRFQVSDRLSITPDFQYVQQAANTINSNGLSIGTLRATFTF